MDLSTETGVSLFLEREGIHSNSVARLSEGFSAFVYRAIPEEPLKDGSKSIVVKHYADYAARAKQFPLDSKRSSFEHSFLISIPAHLPSTLTNSSSFPLRLPRVYDYSTTAHAILLEDVANATSLPRYLRFPTSSPSTEEAAAIGCSLGVFLATVHNLSIEHPDILATFASNDSARRLSAQVFFDKRLLDFANRYGFPWSNESSSSSDPSVDAPWLENIATEQANIVISGPPKNDQGEAESEVLTVGDFWPGNILVTPEKHLVALDFEYAKPGRASFDLGAMAAELWMIGSFGPWPGVDVDQTEHDRTTCPAAFEALRSMLETYKASAKRKVDPAEVAIRIGAHLITTAPAGREAVFGRERIVETVKFGVEMCRAGVEGRKEVWREVIGDF